MLKYWLSVPLIGITLLLAACSDGPSSSGGVTLYTGGGGPFMLTVENQGGHGAIEVCLDDGQACTNTNRIAVAQGQCKTGVGSCTQTIVSTKSEVANGLKIVWSALHTGPNQSYLATAYTCSPGSKGCTTGKTGHMAKLNANKTQIQTVIKFDANSDSATIGGTFSKDMPETAGVNYCDDGGVDVSDFSQASACGQTTIYNGQVFECITQYAQAGDCNTLSGVWLCQDFAPDNTPWGHFAWNLLKACPER